MLCKFSFLHRKCKRIPISMVERLRCNSIGNGGSWAFVSSHTSGHTLNYLKIDCNLILHAKAIEMRLLVRIECAKISFEGASFVVWSHNATPMLVMWFSSWEKWKVVDWSFRHATRLSKSELQIKNSTLNRYCPINFKLTFYYAWQKLQIMFHMNQFKVIIECLGKLAPHQYIVFGLTINEIQTYGVCTFKMVGMMWELKQFVGSWQSVGNFRFSKPKI